jgi:SET domain-containing protein
MLNNTDMTRPSTGDLPIEVRQSSIHGSGAFAVRTINAGQRVGRYTGKVYSPSEAGERDWDHALTFVFALSDGSVIDGAEGGNATRHINHSCAPNCVAYEIESETGEPWIVIEGLRRIRSGEELFLDYSLDAGSDTTEAYTCHCGTKACRGTLIGIADPV